jgi:hypothetical protein
MWHRGPGRHDGLHERNSGRLLSREREREVRQERRDHKPAVRHDVALRLARRRA